MVKDARPSGNVTYTNYDGLNRQFERREANPTTGRLLASWGYDATGQKGLLDFAMSFHTRPNGQGDEAFITDITGYDDRSRPTGKAFTVYADRGGLFGTYQFADPLACSWSAWSTSRYSACCVWASRPISGSR